VKNKREEEHLNWIALRDREIEYRMNIYDNNFYGLKHLMPMIETLAYLALEETWPK
jgi:hypothetical protein